MALECCGTSLSWARAIQQLGRDVKLLPAAYQTVRETSEKQRQ